MIFMDFLEILWTCLQFFNPSYVFLGYLKNFLDRLKIFFFYLRISCFILSFSMEFSLKFHNTSHIKLVKINE